MRLGNFKHIQYTKGLTDDNKPYSWKWQYLVMQFF